MLFFLQRDYNHKPVFKDCATYKPVLKEEEPAGTIVIKVHAEDEDPINNGGKTNDKNVL